MSGFHLIKNGDFCHFFQRGERVNSGRSHGSPRTGCSALGWPKQGPLPVAPPSPLNQLCRPPSNLLSFPHLHLALPEVQPAERSGRAYKNKTRIQSLGPSSGSLRLESLCRFSYPYRPGLFHRPPPSLQPEKRSLPRS